MRSISRELHLAVGATAAFALLHSPSAIRQWWSSARVVVAARSGGVWVGAWGPDEDAPDYITVGRIVAWEPPHRMRLGAFEYFTKDGADLPFVAALETEFLVRPTKTGSVLSVNQTGFPAEPDADAFFAACERGWKATFEGIQRYVTEGAPAGGEE